MRKSFAHIRKFANKPRKGPIPKAFLAFLLFAAMVIVPLLADNMLSRKPDLQLSIPLDASSATIIVVAAATLFLALFWYYAVQDRLDYIESCLQRAERDMNALLSAGMEHGGRKDKAIERSEWNKMAVSPGVQIFNAGYRTPAHDLIELNEKDLAGKGASMGKASATAFLFRELYEGSVSSAQGKIVSDVKNGGNVPYVAPGIRELIGFGKFDKDEGFPEGAGVDDDDLKWVAKRRGYPSDNLIMVSTSATGAKTALRGNDVLIKLTQQRAPRD